MNSARIAALIRTNSWLPNLIFVALCAFFAAGSINAVVAKVIRPIPTLDDAPPSVTVPNANATRHVPLVALAERNLFAIKRESLTPAGEQSGAPQEPAFDLTLKEFKESDLQPCTVNALLRATLVADKPEWSMAIVVKNDTREPAAYSINAGTNAIADDAILVAIRSREIVVRRRDHFERCTGEGDVAGQAPPVPIAPMASNNDEPASPVPGDMSGVTKLSGTDYRVERAEVDKSLTNLNEVATQARIVPSFRNGKANGFKLFSIKPGSIYSKIGLQNGDVIQKINGYDMNSPDRALEIYTKLRDATSLTIELMRGGNVQTMNYAITG